MIIGQGVDIADISRITRACEQGGDAFIKRVYTEYEIAVANEKRNAKWAYYAGRWAAKEAFSKAMGCGIGENCSFTDIEIREQPSGAPLISVSGRALEYLRKLGGSNLHVSISHEARYAVAMVIIEK